MTQVWGLLCSLVRLQRNVGELQQAEVEGAFLDAVDDANQILTQWYGEFGRVLRKKVGWHAERGEISVGKDLLAHGSGMANLAFVVGETERKPNTVRLVFGIYVVVLELKISVLGYLVHARLLSLDDDGEVKSAHSLIPFTLSNCGPMIAGQCRALIEQGAESSPQAARELLKA